MRRKKLISTIFYDADNITASLVKKGHIIQGSSLLFLALLLKAATKIYEIYGL
jgi:hypothetical protein